MRVRPVFATTGLILVAAAAACSSGSTPAAAPPTGNNAAAASSAGSSSTAHGSATKKIDVCASLPAATVSQIVGTTFNTTKPDSVAGVVFGCDYGGPNSVLLQITVDTQAGTGEFNVDRSMKAVGHAPKLVSGLGDEAFSLPNPNGNAGSAGAASFASYGAVFGETYIKIGGMYVTAAQGKQIVEDLQAKL
jgi:hypothetical protein